MITSIGHGSYNDIMEVRASWRESKELCSKLAIKTATEFEMQGFWQWAIFILLLSKDFMTDAQIHQSIEAILVRNSQNLSKDKESFLIDRLRIPEKLIKKCKGFYCMSKKDWPNAIKFLSESEEWNLTHEILYEHIIPTIIISKETSLTAKSLLRMILNKLQLHSSHIKDWHSKGEIVYRYLLIKDKARRKSLQSREMGLKTELFKEIKEIGFKIKDKGMCNKEEAVRTRIRQKLLKYSWVIQKDFYVAADSESQKITVPVPLSSLCCQGNKEVSRVDEDSIDLLVDYVNSSRMKKNSQRMELK
jgi:hypothetical protein